MFTQRNAGAGSPCSRDPNRDGEAAPGPWRPDRISYVQGAQLLRGTHRLASRRCANKHAIDANEPRCIQAAAGLCFGFAKRSVIYADSRCELTYAWPSRALSHDDIALSAAAFRPERHFRLSRHRDPAHAGVCCTVQVESSLLHCSGTDELPKEGTFCFRPTLVSNGGSVLMFRFFRACVNFFHYILRPRCRL